MRPLKINYSAIIACQKAGFKEITPDLNRFYKPEYIDLYGPGDFGADQDLFIYGGEFPLSLT
jgi:hypothetical protein